MQAFGNVFALSSTTSLTTCSGTWGVCPCAREDWAFAARPAEGLPRAGQVEPIRCRPSRVATQSWQWNSSRPWTTHVVLSISRVLLNAGRFCLTGALTHPGGGQWPMVCDLAVVSMMLNPQKRHTDGNAQLQALPRNASGAARCGQGCRQETELCCGLKAVLFLECRSPVPLPSTSRDSRRRNFGSSFCVAFGSPFL